MLALMRDTSKLVALGTATTAFAKAQIQVYSPAGEGLLLFSVVISSYYSAGNILIHRASKCAVGPREDHTLWVDGR